MKLIITHTEPQTDEELHISQAKDIVDNSVNHLIVGDSLDYIGNRLENLKILLSKLRFDGIIEISGLDIFAFARAVYTAGPTLPTINRALYDGRQSVSSLIGILELLKEAKLDIEIKQLDTELYSYYIKAKRCLPKR